MHSNNHLSPVLLNETKTEDFTFSPCEKEEKIAHNNFLKGTKWSPDGRVFVSCSEDSSIRLFSIPPNIIDIFYNSPEFQPSFSSYEVQQLIPFGQIDEAECVFDFCWYPSMDWQSPESCYLATTCRDHPIRVYNIATGDVISFIPFNHVDAVSSVYSLAFHPSGQRLYGGGKNVIRVFDCSRPGRQYQDYQLATRKSKVGQKGIISSFAFCTVSVDEENSNLFAVGSYGRSVYVYDERASSACMLFSLKDVSTTWGGVTQLMWPSENTIISGHRDDEYLRCWDIRKAEDVLFRLRREAHSSQRYQFDVKGDTVVSGNTNGRLLLYSLKTGLAAYPSLEDSPKLHNSALTGAQFHSNLPLLLTSSGTRVFPEFEFHKGKPDEGLSSDEDAEKPEEGTVPAALYSQADTTMHHQPHTAHTHDQNSIQRLADNAKSTEQLDNSIRIWFLPQEAIPTD